MSTHLTPELSASRYVPENCLDAYDSCLSQTELGFSYNDAIFDLRTFSFDHEYNGLSNSSLFNEVGMQDSSRPDQSLSYSQTSVTPSSNNAFGLVDDNPLINTLTSSLSLEGSYGFGEVRLLEHNTLNDSVYYDEIANLQDADCSATDCTWSQDIPTLLRTHSSRQSNTFPDHIPSALQPQDSIKPQHGYQYHGYGGTISPQCIMNEQHIPLLSGYVAAIEADFDTALLVSATSILDSESHASIMSSEPLQRQSKQSQAMPEIIDTAANLGGGHVKVKRRRRRKPPPPPEVAAAKRRAFLQRNREAASKCRIKQKHQISNMEDEERIKRPLNAVLKNEFEELRREVLSLREMVQDITCAEECEGCGEHAPMRKGSLAAISSISVWSESEQVDEEEV